MFKMTSFVYDAVEYLRDHEFDGFEIDWEYPRGDEEKEKYTQLLKVVDEHMKVIIIIIISVLSLNEDTSVLSIKELREAFDGEAKANKVPRLLLSAAVPASSEVIKAGYDVGEISK